MATGNVAIAPKISKRQDRNRVCFELEKVPALPTNDPWNHPTVVSIRIRRQNETGGPSLRRQAEMERPVHLIPRLPRFTPRTIAAISGAAVFDAAVIYFVATGLTFSGMRAIPHTIEAEVLKVTPPPTVEPVVVPQTH